MKKTDQGIPFDKVHACGNDFILVDEVLSKVQIEAVCDRYHGVGADGIMVVLSNNSPTIEFGHFDPDGSRSFCLNGIRAALSALFQKGKIPESGRVSSEGVALEYTIDGEVAVGLPRKPYRPLVWRSPFDEVPGFVCDVGNPHFICWEIPELEFNQLAPRIRADYDAFSKGTNVNWLAQTEEGWRIRTYERGVENFTRACGSGMYASALVIAGECGQSDVLFLPDGKGRVATQLRPDALWLSGTTVWVATGVWRWHG